MVLGEAMLHSLLKNLDSYQGIASAMPKVAGFNCPFRRLSVHGDFFRKLFSAALSHSLIEGFSS